MSAYRARLASGVGFFLWHLGFPFWDPDKIDPTDFWGFPVLGDTGSLNPKP